MSYITIVQDLFEFGARDPKSCLKVDFFHFRGHKSYIICAAILDTFVFTGSADTTIKKWSLTTNECLFTYESHTSKIHKILATENLLFSTSNDKTAKVWHTNLTKQANRDRPLIRTFKVSSM